MISKKILYNLHVLLEIKVYFPENKKKDSKSSMLTEIKTFNKLPIELEILTNKTLLKQKLKA